MVRPPLKVRLHSASSAASFCAACPPLSRTISWVSSLGAVAAASAASLHTRIKQGAETHRHDNITAYQMTKAVGADWSQGVPQRLRMRAGLTESEHPRLAALPNCTKPPTHSSSPTPHT
jgi:hypothetical protein